MTFDPTKPCKTKRGDWVEIVSVNGREPYTIIGYVGDNKDVSCWTKDGSYSIHHGLSDLDLVNLPQEADAWLNVYRGLSGLLYGGSNYPSRKEADHGCASDRVACIRVKLVEGQFDD